MDTDWHILKRLTLRAGLRLNTLYFQTDDQLGNFAAPATRPQDQFIQGYRRSASGTVLSPRASASYDFSPRWSLNLAYGEGFRSPQARTLEEGQRTPFTKVRSGDFGLRLTPFRGARLQTGIYASWLSDDIAFSAQDASLTRVGPTRRSGFYINWVSKSAQLGMLAISLTGTDAIILQPPPPSVEEPSVPFVENQRLPFVAPWVARIDMGSPAFTLAQWSEDFLMFKIGAAFSYTSPRPLPFAGASPSYALVDTNVELSWRKWSLRLGGQNIFNQEYAAFESIYTSDFNPNDNQQTRVPQRHIAAGQGRTLMLTLGYGL